MILKEETFRKINLVTLVSVFLLIFIGGIVRNLDSGMGCPDWPRCFGGYFPPSDESQLPDDYQKVYAQSRVIKNERLAGYLESLGFERVSEKLKGERAQMETKYDFTKAWVEYGNRLMGVLIGFLIILNMIWSFSSPSAKVKVIGVGTFFLVLFQGWIGSLVVSTNLLPGFITFHMFLAILLVLLLISQLVIKQGNVDSPTSGKQLLLILFISFFIQIFMGTWVREQVDALHAQGLGKVLWVSNLNVWFYLHRSFSLMILTLTIYLFFKNRQLLRDRVFQWFLIIVICEVLLGVVMVYFTFPVLSQPLHLLFGTVALGLLFYLFLRSTSNQVSYAGN